MGIVSMSNILDVVAQFKRPLIEGEAVLDSKMLVIVGKLARTDYDDDNILKVWSLCLQSSATFSDPHQLEIHLDLCKIGADRFSRLYCSCTAGESAKCKHLIALLMHLFKLDSEDDLEELSCTDREQQWGKIKASVKKDFEPIPISDYESVDKYIPPIYSRGTPSVDSDLAEQFAKKIAAGDSTCEVFLHSHKERLQAAKANVEGAREEEAAAVRKSEDASTVTINLLRQPLLPSCKQMLCELKAKSDQILETLPPDLQTFYNEHVNVSAEKAVDIARNTASQNEEKWFRERMLRITGSKCYGLYTYSSNKNADWDKKMRTTFNSSFTGNQATVYGLVNEPVARSLYSSKKKCRVVQNGLFVNPLLPWLGSSVDGLVVGDENNPKKSIEIKCLTVGKTKPASDIPKFGKCFDKDKCLKKRHEFYGQIQLGLLLMALPECDFVVFSSLDQDIETVSVPFDEAFAYAMVDKLINVYFCRVLPWLKENFE